MKPSAAWRTSILPWAESLANLNDATQQICQVPGAKGLEPWSYLCVYEPVAKVHRVEDTAAGKYAGVTNAKVYV